MKLDLLGHMVHPKDRVRSIRTRKVEQSNARSRVMKAQKDTGQVTEGSVSPFGVTAFAAVAHSLNDPLAAVIANITLTAEALDEAPDESSVASAREFLRAAKESAERLRQVVKRLTTPATKSLVDEHRSRRPRVPHRAHRAHILVIDDEHMIGLALERSLRHHEVRVLDHAKDALDLVRTGERFDVIFCDLMMPEMTGMDLYEEVVRVAPDQATKMVFITGGATTTRARDFMATVPNPVIEKPFDVRQVRELIRARGDVLHRRARVVYVVDDDAAARKLAVRCLANAGFECEEHGSESALEALHGDEDRVDAVVLDVMMPGGDGFGVAAAMKADPTTAPIPIIMLTAHAVGEEEIARGVETGAAFYLTKPFSGPVLVAQVRAACERFDVERELRAKLHFAEGHATTDALTGLLNRRAFDGRLAEGTANATRHREPLSLVMLDLDHFKQVNDTFGHDGGDQILLYFARALRRAVRVGDQAFRYGGEEFALLLPKCDAEGAMRVVARIQQDLRARAVALGSGRTTVVRFSAGVATAHEHTGFGVENLVGRADALLYKAKSDGRDRVVVECASAR